MEFPAPRVIGTAARRCGREHARLIQDRKDARRRMGRVERPGDARRLPRADPRRAARAHDGRKGPRRRTWPRRSSPGSTPAAGSAHLFRGERLPTLDDALAFLDELHLGAMIEVKAGPGDGPRTMGVVLHCLGARKLRIPCHLSSFDEDALARASEERPDIPRALIVENVPADWLARVERLKCGALHAGERGLTAARVAAVAAKRPLRAYTVNAPARANALFQWGVAAVFTDCPDVIISAVGHRSGGPAETGSRGSSQK